MVMLALSPSIYIQLFVQATQPCYNRQSINVRRVEFPCDNAINISTLKMDKDRHDETTTWT